MEQVHLFTKKLKPTHISHTLSVPTHVLEAFPFPQGAHTMKFEAVDAIDNVWRFCLSTRLTGAYPKPVLLRSSWHRFVEQKGLAPEDRVVFFMERDEDNDMVRRYTVRAQRKVMILMGQDIWVDVEDLPLTILGFLPATVKPDFVFPDAVGLLAHRSWIPLLNSFVSRSRHFFVLERMMWLGTAGIDRFSPSWWSLRMPQAMLT
ncbi:hypothetical protein POTOM_011347 [Populus tomentosa]|uniref:TF-B3 domain-containing protein n=1 Tax=Populus tomentosa TaxID=118781 RepID=A0A8X8A7Q5_POPTO|nr:hypothetical protein POTOM_011347 [Populus tomentosa]